MDPKLRKVLREWEAETHRQLSAFQLDLVADFALWNKERHRHNLRFKLIGLFLAAVWITAITMAAMTVGNG